MLITLLYQLHYYTIYIILLIILLYLLHYYLNSSFLATWIKNYINVANNYLKYKIISLLMYYITIKYLYIWEIYLNSDI